MGRTKISVDKHMHKKYRIQLNDKMAGLGFNISSSESKPTRNAYVVYEDLAMKIDAEIKIKISWITMLRI
jgi:hypothetical protein